MSHFDNHDRIMDWVDAEERSTVVKITARCFLRCLPMVLKTKKETQTDVLTIMFRSAIITAVSGKLPSTETRTAAHAAGDAAYALDIGENSLINAAQSSVLTARTVNYAVKTVKTPALAANAITLSFTSSISDIDARNAAEIDASNLLLSASNQDILEEKLWHQYQQTSLSVQTANRFLEFLNTNAPIWGFWQRWYGGFLNGTPIDWNIQLAVASLPDEDWEKGPEWIAGKIAEIEAEHRRTAKAQLPAEDVIAQSVRLLERPLLLETNAKGLQQLSQMAIDAYRREISNALPDCIEPLENIPGIAFEIACIAARDIQLSDKEALLAEQIQLMAGVIAELNGRLKRVPEPAPSGRKIFADAFYEKSGERVAELVTSKMLWGGLAAGAGFIFGTPGDALIDTLSQCYNSVVAPEASSISNPSITWHAPPKT